MARQQAIFQLAQKFALTAPAVAGLATISTQHPAFSSSCVLLGIVEEYAAGLLVNAIPAVLQAVQSCAFGAPWYSPSAFTLISACWHLLLAIASAA